MFNEFRPPERDPDRVIGNTNVPPPNECDDVDAERIPAEVPTIEDLLPGDS